MITIHLDPETILYSFLAVGIILAFLSRFVPDKKPAKKGKTHSPQELAKIKKEIERLNKMLKD